MDKIYLEVVNKKLKTIKKETYDNIHKFGLLHKAVHILIINNVGKIFVRQRALSKKNYPGYYSTSVGAHLLPGQNFREAAKINLIKFFGLNLPLIRIGGEFIKDKFENEYTEDFICYSDNILFINKNEMQSGKFLSLEEIANIKEKFTPHLKKSIDQYNNFIKKK
jgi:isopentenyl-diphosphate Delta-isomerase